MEDSSSSFPAGQFSGHSNYETLPDNSDPNGLKESAPKLTYSMPGVLHFLQSEWSKFEMERSQWEVERAELQARIAFLQGERKGQENLKHDLVRRIKMLEFALKQERAKFHRLKFGTDPPNISPSDLIKPDLDSGGDDMPDPEDLLRQTVAQSASSKAKAKEGRQLIRQYLQEIGYTDVILDVKQARVQQMIGSTLDDVGPASGDQRVGNKATTIKASPHKTIAEQLSNLMPGINITGEDESGSDDDEMRYAKEEEGLPEEDQVIAEFDFLVNQQEMRDHDENGSSDSSVSSESDLDWGRMNEKMRSKVEAFRAERIRGTKRYSNSRSPNQSVLNAFAGGSDSPDDGGSSASISEPVTGPYPDMNDPEMRAAVTTHSPSRNEDEGFQSALGLNLGDLEDITVSNDADGNSTSSNLSESNRRAWTAKFNLRSHFDSVRCLSFHPSEAALVTGAEDHTLKLWNIGKHQAAGGSVGSKRASSAVDLEPIYTFRGHSGAVLCVSLLPSRDSMFSGSLDGTVRVWKWPSLTLDPYDAFDNTIMGPVLSGHTDAVWSICLTSSGSDVAMFSASADKTIRVWHPLIEGNDAIVSCWDQEVTPSGMNSVTTDPTKLVVSYVDGSVKLLDASTGQTISTFEQANCRANCVLTHPAQPLTIAGYDDRQIRFFDNNSGSLVHGMVAHLDSVTSLAVDHNGLYLLSGSHDSSIRLWNLDDKSCVQEITAHRKKFDEAIHDVALHPTRSFLASAGADAVAKVFV